MYIPLSSQLSSFRLRCGAIIYLFSYFTSKNKEKLHWCPADGF